MTVKERDERMKRTEISTKWRKMFPIENIIQFDLEHWRDCVWGALEVWSQRRDRSGDRLTFTGANLAYGWRGIAKTILCKGKWVVDVGCRTAATSILTGKVSKAFKVRRKVFGCLSRDEGEREGGLRCAMSREGRGVWERGKGKGEGRRRREGRKGRGVHS
jgi:hypothetical protein